MKKTFTKIFKDNNLPFLELRYSNSNAHYKKHFHDTFSLGVNKKGKSIYTNGNDSYVLDTNILSIINPNVVHSCNSTTDVLNEYYMMYLDTDWCRDIQKQIDPSLTTFVNIPDAILNNNIFYESYITLCEYLFEEHTPSEKEETLIIFYIDFFSLFLDNKIEVIVDEKFQVLVTYINNNYKENITLEELSLKYELNPFYIIRLFKSQMSLTPRAYLLNVKINKAKELLQNGQSIVETALECGFVDQSHFHKNFLKIVATTPKEYKLNFIQ
jgi:AraC-like DNA-binding protein